jgi:glycosyltransferase involved in cell wall biosynthesis
VNKIMMQAPKIAALIWATNRPRSWVETALCVSHIQGVNEVYFCLEKVSVEYDDLLCKANLKLHIGSSISEAVSLLVDEGYEQILIVTQPVAACVYTISIASSWMAKDPRVGTLSFLSNGGGYLSFPHRNTEVPFGVDGHNEITLTQRLRTRLPLARPTPISIPEGAINLLGRSALVVCDGLSPEFDKTPQIAIAEFGLNASRRGFNNFLDANTFVTRVWDGPHYRHSALNDFDSRHQLHLKHHFFPGLCEEEKNSLDAPVAQAMDLARAKATGLRVLIDGSVLGPMEMGTQLLILALSLALAKEPEVQWVGVAVPDPKNLPNYASALKFNNKIQLLHAGSLDFPDAPQVDIIHRPFQPGSKIPWDRWRHLAKRTLITVQDLIAYRNGFYFKNSDEWREYRNNFRAQVAQADGIVSISHDVVDPILEEALPISKDSIFVIENGIDFRSSNEAMSMPNVMIERGLEAASFLVVLGATYAHKNRDFAIKIWAELKKRGHKLALVLVGANVPFGSTRGEEAYLLNGTHKDVVILADVSGEERNWLLRHSSLALYTTAAEGFGQIPFEAAQFDKPSLFVSFGPLKELINDDKSPEIFDLEALVERAEELLTDSSAAKQLISKIKGLSSTLSWQQTAKKSVDAYFELLSRPKKY